MDGTDMGGAGDCAGGYGRGDGRADACVAAGESTALVVMPVVGAQDVGVGDMAGGPVRRQARRHDGLNAERRGVFLATLAETCNVSLSAREAGVAVSSVRGLRARDDAFAYLWQLAIERGRERLHEGALATMLTLLPRDGGDTGTCTCGGAATAMKIDQAFKALAIRDGEGRAAGKPAVRAATQKAIDAALLRRFALTARPVKPKKSVGA